MKKIELTLAPTYVPSWTYVDAIRELFQNALDQEAQYPGNAASWRYDKATNTMYISNATSKLTAASLLLGHTTKASSESTVGQFGEGYKIATLVLLREGKRVVFYNYGAKEIWRPRFVKSRKFGTDILTFFIEKVDGPFKKPQNADLTLSIEGITPEEYEKIAESNLLIRTDYTVVEETVYGQVLDLKGKVFVNGLYVCDYEPYEYGYNFKPQYIKLDRDRKMVSDFDLRWKASRMWSASSNKDKVMDMVIAGKADVAYIKDVDWQSYELCNTAASRFYDVYGPEAIPVTTQEELEDIPDGYKGIVVNSCYNDLIRGSSDFVMPTHGASSPLANLQQWFDNVKGKLSESDIVKFESLMEDLQDAISC